MVLFSETSKRKSQSKELVRKMTEYFFKRGAKVLISDPPQSFHRTKMSKIDLYFRDFYYFSSIKGYE